MRRITAIALLAMSSAVAGCGGDSTAPTPASLAGTWNLSTINGSALPFTLQAANPKIEYLNEQIIASANGTFTQTANARFTNAGVVSTQPITDSGTWVLSGTAISFQFASDGSTGTGTLSGNTFTVAQSGFSFVYTKQ
jgi:Lipocalin-like domain